MRLKKILAAHKDSVAGVLLFALGLAMFIGAFSIKALLKTASTTSSFMPKTLGIIMMLLSALLVAKDLLKKNADENASALTAETVEDMEKLVGVVVAEKDAAPEEESSREGARKRILFSILLLAGYVFALRDVGFLITTVVYVTCQALILTKPEDRKKYWIRWLLIALIVAVSVYYLFRYTLNLMLPRGILG